MPGEISEVSETANSEVGIKLPLAKSVSDPNLPPPTVKPKAFTPRQQLRDALFAPDAMADALSWVRSAPPHRLRSVAYKMLEDMCCTWGYSVLKDLWADALDVGCSTV